MRHRLLAFVLLAACASEPQEGEATCTDADALDDGVVTATVDGAAWESTATWRWAGESVQITADAADGWNITFVGQTTPDGTTAKAAVDAGSFPVEITLEEGAGGFATAYPTDGDSYSTNGSSGALTLTGLEGDVLAACFGFTAARSGGAEVEVDAGAARATPFEM